jgi:hypothetical protein
MGINVVHVEKLYIFLFIMDDIPYSLRCILMVCAVPGCV